MKSAGKTYNKRETRLKAFLVLLFIFIITNAFGAINISTTPVSGCGKSDGKATITVTGLTGSFEFEYSVDGGAYQTANEFTNLAKGAHTAKIREKKTKCEFSKEFQIEESNALTVNISGLGTTTFCDNTTPSVTLTATASGGSGNYEYSWPGGSMTVSSGGRYSVTVTDKETGCTESLGGDVIFVPIVCSRDPNDIVGPEGYGPGKMISKFESQPYKIRFENDPKAATAPAQVVKITHPLDPDVNIFSFRLADFGFGQFVFQVPENKTFYAARLDVVEALGVVVDVTAGIDVTKKEAFWIFESKDPKTGLPPTDASLGFLPLNDTTGIGDGYVSYTIRSGNQTVTGDTINARASIVFDLNAPIETPQIFNTIDAAPPASKLDPNIASDNSNAIILNWAGQDEPQGSGVRSYALYVSENGGPFTAYQSGITETTTTFTGNFGSSYNFYTRAMDNVGNQEAIKQSPEASVLLKGRTLTITGLTDQSICQNAASGPIGFAVTDGSNAVSGASISISSSNTVLVSGSNILLGGLADSPVMTVTPVPGQSGTTTLTVKALSADGGSGEASFILTVLPVPQLVVTNPQAVCAPAMVDITATFTDQADIAGVLSYWKDDQATVPLDNPQAVSESGTYYIKKTAASGGCADIKPVAVTITPAFMVEAGPDQVVLLNSATFALTGFSPTGGTWSGTGVDANGTFTPSAAGEGTHTLTYTVTQDGCTRSDNMQVRVTTDQSTPVITSFSPPSGSVGDRITISGINFTGATAVSFNGVNAPAFTVVSASEVMATVPQGATTGKISVVTPAGTATSVDDFIVQPTDTQNVAPVLTVAGPMEVNEGSLLTRTASATDANGDVITYSLVGEIPAGAAIDPATGTVTWTPEEAQGPGEHALTVRATDNGSPALYDEESVQILVAEVNAQPVLAAIGDQTVGAGATLAFTTAATDPDLPANILRFALAGAPAGATIDAVTGAFSWTPGNGQAGQHTFTIQVTDNGVPALTAEAPVTVTVTVAQFTLTTAVQGSGSVTKDPDQATYASGSTVTLMANPAAGYVFAGWSGDASGITNPLAVVMEGNKTITATFMPVSEFRVVSFSLINAATDQVIRDIAPDEEINLAALPSRSINIRANTNPAVVGSVRFMLRGREISNPVDNVPPYALFGDSGGDYHSWRLASVGNYRLTAMPYTQSGGGGTAGTPLTISFSVVNEPSSGATIRLGETQRAGSSDPAQLRKLYPNPTYDGHIKVQLPKAVQGKITYTLVSSGGQKVAAGTITLDTPTSLLAFDFSRELRTNGVYFLRLEGANVKEVLKLMRLTKN